MRRRTAFRPVLRPLAAVCALVAGLGAAAITSGAGPAAAATPVVTRSQAVLNAEHYATSRGYKLGVAVLDTRTGQTYQSDGYSTFASESVVKTMIATRLLLQGRMHGDTASRAYKMITQSDDAIASAFYGSVGGDGLINYIKSHYGLPSLGSPPHRAGWWGNTHITAVGMVQFYAKVKRDPAVGPWLINAMHHATTHGSDGVYQYFGLPQATSSPAIKQGWGLDYDDWSASADYNSTGFVNGDRYTVALLARGPSRTYGSGIGNLLSGAAKQLLPGGTFPDPTPIITDMSALHGPLGGGQHLTIHGTDFTHLIAINFDATPGIQPHYVSPTTVQVYTPRTAAGHTVQVHVITAHGSSTVGGGYTYVAPPAITWLSTHSGSVRGGALVIAGRNFIGVNRVMFGSTQVRVLSTTPTSAHIAVPAHSAGTVDVRVVTPYGISPATTVDRFTWVGPPTITSLSPASGTAAGGPMTITGSGFRPGDVVYFGATAVRPHLVSSTSFAVTRPASQGAGSYPIHVRGHYAYSNPATFTVTG